MRSDARRDVLVRCALGLIPPSARWRWGWTGLVVSTLVPLWIGAAHAGSEVMVLVAGAGALAIGWLWGAPGGVIAGLAGWLTMSRLDTSAFGLHDLVTPVVLGAAVGILRSVIQRLSTELERRERVEGRLRDVFEGVPVGLYRSSWEGEILDVNPAFAEMVGYTVDELLTMRAEDLYADPASRARQLESWPDDERRGDVLALRHRDGSVVYGRFHSRLIRDEAGRPRYLEGAVRDVTALLAAEAEARQADQLFQRIFDQAPIGVALSDANGRMVAANRALGDLLGLKPEDLVGEPWIQFTHPEDRPPNVEGFADVVAGRSDGFELEKRVLRSDGTEAWVLVRAGAIRDADGGFVYQVAHLMDITARRRAEEELQRLVEAKDEFIAAVSHELRTPLAVVMGLANELRRGWRDFDEGEVTELVGLVADQSAELANLVDDLLVAARADIGKVSVYPRAVPVASLVADVCGTLPGAERVDTSGVEMVTAWADPMRFRQVLRNLVTNALRYGGSRVEVAATAADGAITVEVRDDGAGIPAESAERIFEPYQRAHDSHGLAGSVGLGLTVSRTLARLMGGDLTHQRRDGMTCFMMRLPDGAAARGDRYHAPPVAASGPVAARPRRPVV